MESSTDSLFSAVKQGDLKAVEEILKHNPDLVKAKDSSGLSAVLTAMYYGQPAVADWLIEHGAPLDVFEACAAGKLDQARDLIDKTPSLVNAWAPDGFQPLGLACFFGYTTIVDMLLKRGAQVNSPSQNPLKVQPLNSAVAGQHMEIARLLLGHGADANARQGEDFTPLHGAAQNGQAAMIRLLLEYGANPSAKDARGRTPADLAVESGHPEVVQFLQ
jgi:ankyrin repeat protein